MSAKKVKIGSFLKERKTRFKPDEANELGLRRVNKIDFSGNIHLVEHKPTRTNMILVKKGDLLISGINAEKGGVSVYEYEEDAIATIHYSSYLYDAEKIDVEYLKWFLKSNIFKNLLIAQAGSGIKSELKPNRFLPLEIDLPTLSEQKEKLQKLESINSEIEELHEIVEQNEKLISKLRQSILEDAVQGKITEKWRKHNPKIESASELLKRIEVKKEQLIKEKKIKKEKQLPTIKKNEIPFVIPENWKWCRFLDISNIASNLVKPDLYLDYPHIGPDSILKDRGVLLSYDTVREDNLISAKHLFFPGQILYSKIRPHLNKVVEIDFEGLCSADMYPIDSFIERGYLFRFMLSKVFVEQSMKSESRVAMPKINQSELSKILIPIPPIIEQEVIVKKINQLMEFCDNLELEINTSKKNVDLLLHEVIGELLGQEKMSGHNKNTETKTKVSQIRKSKFDSNTTYMELVKLLKEHGKLHAEELWKMSEFPNDIDAFYAELKKQIEEEKTIKEVEKGYLELA